jgi:uncharacterized protein YigE (DUF2233 family)
LLPFVLVVAVFALWRNTRALHWRAAGAGAEFTTFSGEPLCRMGSSEVAVLRLDPARVRVRARYYDRMRPARLLSILEWQRTTGALAVFNAGQFYPDFHYMGVLVCGGDTVSSRQHLGFQAALVARDGRATVLDLADNALARQGAWSDVAQSFMLFGRDGGVRVKRTDRIANRTAVGVDERGWLVVCVSEGAYTLADFAQVLRRAPLRLTHAMSMDGGLEANLVVKAPGLRYASFGDWSTDHEPTAPGAVVPLPAVITLEER